MFEKEKKDRLLGLIKNLKSENQNNSKLIIRKLEEIKNKQSYSSKSDIANIMNSIRSILFSSDRGGTNSYLDRYSWSNFAGSTIHNFYNTSLSHFRRKFDNPISDILFGLMSKIDIKRILGFAHGGEIPINNPVLVGENGPELFMSKTAGNIIPNNQIFNEIKKKEIPPINFNFSINVSKENEISNELEKAMPRITSLVQNSLLDKLHWINI